MFVHSTPDAKHSTRKTNHTWEIVKLEYYCVNIQVCTFAEAGVSLTFSAREQLVFTGRQNYLNKTSL